jgi:hypothetical protein
MEDLKLRRHKTRAINTWLNGFIICYALCVTVFAYAQFIGVFPQQKYANEIAKPNEQVSYFKVPTNDREYLGCIAAFGDCPPPVKLEEK